MIEHPIPIEALDSDIAILGKKGGGKTYTAKGIVERLLDLKRRVLILDPLGVWAGLRTSADGEGDGYPVAIFGGEHADLPLDPAAAKPLARIIANENLPAVIDIADLSKNKQQAFLFSFLHELRTVNREALTVVLEEADVFAPQNPMGDDSKRLFGEIDWIARRGRFRGFRLITITQRPARLSKDVLTQCATLIAHRLPAPQDREAVKAWVDGNGDRDKAKEVFDTLAQLPVGEAWVWAPELDVLDRIKFPLIKTLDTSATPKAGEKRVEPKTLAQVDVSTIREALITSTDDKPHITKRDASSSPVPIDETHPVVRRLVTAAHAKGVRAGFTSGMTEAKRRVLAFAGDFVVDGAEPDTNITGSSSGRTQDFDSRNAGSIPAPATKPKLAKSGNLSTNPLLVAAQSVFPVTLSWAVLAAMCGRKARGGHFNTTRKALIDQGYVSEIDGSVVPANAPKTPEGVIPADLLEQNLPQPAAKMFGVIRRNGPIHLINLAGTLGMQPRGGHWNTGMSILRKNSLIVETDGQLTIQPKLETSR